MKCREKKKRKKKIETSFILSINGRLISELSWTHPIFDKSSEDKNGPDHNFVMNVL